MKHTLRVSDVKKCAIVIILLLFYSWARLRAPHMTCFYSLEKIIIYMLVYLLYV